MHFAIEGVSCMQHITERLAPFRCYARDLDDPFFGSRYAAPLITVPLQRGRVF
jgi:hypothetical protein